MIGVPIKLLHQTQHHVVSVEMKSGEMFKGYLAEAEDTMNVRLDDVTMYTRDGKNIALQQVYLRGGQIRFIIVPTMFKHAPMFKRVRQQAKSKITQQTRDKYKKARQQVLSQMKLKK